MDKKYKIFLDNNSIDYITNNFDKFNTLKEICDFYITPIILEEVIKIPDSKIEKRISNIITLFKLDTKLVNDSVLVWDCSRWDYSNFGDGKIYNEILIKETKSNTNDAIMADSANFYNFKILTCDKRLIKKLKKNKIDFLTFNQFINLITETDNI
ncbi:MAG TPA: hypothetical protein IAD04_04270 [Candidatus Caccosoma faecigallinarum]|uniref:PIN domain-containing protein n=1 Tax=Candidatus Caccosoma faecigallinarum TaxID=2840720 RepID=A0A9D1G9K1_9FIRM|nr:hypothetical protein [Candidatus Caccosoma faecigallinarum]